MEWEVIKSLLDYSVPLALLVVFLLAARNGCNWVAVHVLLPTFGVDGYVPAFLERMSGEYHGQTTAMRDMNLAIREAGHGTLKRMDELLLVANRDAEEQDEMGRHVYDLLEIHASWAAAASELFETGHAAHAHIAKIREITLKYKA